MNKTRIGDPVRHREYAAAREFIRQKYPNGLDAIALAEFSLERNEHLQKMLEKAQQIVMESANMTAMPSMTLPTFPQSSELVPHGAESADIWKLDGADKSGSTNCATCGKQILTASTAVASGMMPKLHEYFCTCTKAAGVEMGKVNRVDEKADV